MDRNNELPLDSHSDQVLDDLVVFPNFEQERIDDHDGLQPSPMALLHLDFHGPHGPPPPNSNVQYDLYPFYEQDEPDPAAYKSPPHFAVDILDEPIPPTVQLPAPEQRFERSSSAQPAPPISPLPPMSPRLSSPPPLPIPPPTRARPSAPQSIATSPVSSPRVGNASALPLQVQAQLFNQHEEAHRNDQVNPQRNPVGHTRAPEIPREPSLLESLSRTVRNIVPVPGAVPSPTIPRPLSFGSFMPTSPVSSGSQTPSHQPHRHITAQQGAKPQLVPVSAYGITHQSETRREGYGAAGFDPSVGEGMTYPWSSNQGGFKDPVIWSRWDTLGSSPIIIIAYASGLQIWDCSNLRGVVELLNLNFGASEWNFIDGETTGPSSNTHEPSTIRRVAHAGILSTPRQTRAPRGGQPVVDPFESDRPLLGLLMTQRSREGAQKSFFVIYSLHTHTILKHINLSGTGSHFEANDHFLIISTSTPPAIHVLSTLTLQSLLTIPSSSLVPFAHKSSVNKLIPPAPDVSSMAGSAHSPSDEHQSHHRINNNHNIKASIVSLLPDNTSYNASHPTNAPDTYPYTHLIQVIPEPEPVFTLSQRLLAFASVPPHHVAPSSHHPRTSNNAHLQATPHTGIPIPATGINRSASPSRSRSRASSQSVSASASSSSPPSVAGFAPSQPMSRGTPPTTQPIHHYQQQRIMSPTVASPVLSSPRVTAHPQHHHRRSVGSVITATTNTEMVGNAALKVGGSVLSGMRALGGLAFTAAAETTKNVVGSAMNAGGAGPTANKFFSRSAPSAGVYGPGSEEGGVTKERRFSNADEANALGDLGILRKGWVSGLGPASPPEGYYLTVLDLQPLLHTPLHAPGQEVNQGKETSQAKKRRMPQPLLVAEFRASETQRITRLRFSRDGNSVLVATEAGHSALVYALKPHPVTLRHVHFGHHQEENEGEGSGNGGQERGGNGNVPPWHVYDLRRGRTSAVVESTEWDGEGRWIAVGTRNRTVHVFAVNPYGGKPDIRSHVHGKVQNVADLQPLSTVTTPLVRLRSTVPPAIGMKAPLSFTFITPSEVVLSNNLLPSPTVAPSTSPSTRVLDPSPPSPHHQYQQRPTNYQDILLFDPADGLLSLRRFTLETRTINEHSKISGVATSVTNFTGTSISLPKFGSGGSNASSPSGRLSVSPNTTNTIGGAGGARGRVTGKPGSKNAVAETQNLELVSKESIVARWDLQRRGDWEEVKRKLGSGKWRSEKVKEEDQPRVQHLRQGSSSDWLAQAELSTHSRSPRVYPRTIYLSHQFSFHTLGEDYHALIRRYKLDIGGTKVTVRRAVEISAFGTSFGRGDAFVEGFPSSLPRDIREIGASSFDEPLASAMAGAMDYKLPQTVIPMLPNGMPGASKPMSFRNSIPIRSAVDGVGRLGREVMHKVRSPPLLPRSSSQPRNQAAPATGPVVPLEFNEEDEEFLYTDLDDAGPHATPSLTRGGNLSGASASTGNTSALALDMEDEVQLISASSMGGGGLTNIEVIEPEENWHGWDVQDKLAVEEAERFDDISVVGFLDEEQETQKQAAQRRRRK